MARLPRAKLDILKNAFIAEGKTPGQAAKDAVTSYATAKRYYDLWDDEIKKGLESALIPQLEQSLRRMKPARRGSDHVKREEKAKGEKVAQAAATMWNAMPVGAGDDRAS